MGGGAGVASWSGGILEIGGGGVGLLFEVVLVRVRYQQIVELAFEVLDEQYVETAFVHRDCLLLSSLMSIAIA